MKNHLYLLQIDLPFHLYKYALLCFATAFVVTLISIPPQISLMRRFHLLDVPTARKEHQLPIPTMGGLSIAGGMLIALLLWLPFSYEPAQVAFFFSVIMLLGLGIMDDMRDLSAKYKFIIQIALAIIIALAGIRVTSFDGLFGIYELPLLSQYTFTILAIVGIVNAFNLIDGIDGLAGGLGFMSLITLGLFLILSGDNHTALIAFALAGGLFAFLYFNFNPARIFMGDTGSLVLGFVVAVLSIRLLQLNVTQHNPVIRHAPLFVLGIVLIPVFDTLRVFAMRIWRGRSPFVADRTHLHHLLTNQGFGHAFTTRVICSIHAFVLLESYLLNGVRQEWLLIFLILFMVVVSLVLRKLRSILPNRNSLVGATSTSGRRDTDLND
ncbi:MAG: MraY family glycosyltransferase [Chitinophagaceae bacterium]